MQSMMKYLALLLVFVIVMFCANCASASEQVQILNLKINGNSVPVEWESNASVEALKNLAPVTVKMSRYGGFEQVGSLGAKIVRNDTHTTTQPGDIVLYSGNQIVIFYGSNSWAYTRLGKIKLSERELRAILQNQDVNITLSN